jgi:predicted small secreted protein
MLKRLLVLVSLASAAALAGCNTMHGVGKDIERGGEKIQGASDRAKQ